MFVDKEEHVYRTVLGRNGFHLGAQKGILHKLSSLLDDDDTNTTINSKGKVLLLIIHTINFRYQCYVQNGDTPLHLACTEGHSEVVRWLIMKKADLNAVNRVSICCAFFA
jgi:ankyrin repeat protein